MNFEEAIRAKMQAWPVLYSNRAAVLQGFFLVYGGGAYWAEDGTIEVYDDGDPINRMSPLERENQLHAQSMAEKRRNSPPEFLEQDLAWREQYHAETISLIHDVLNNLEERASGAPCLITHHFFSLREGNPCCLLHIPDNCQPDWVMGAREMCALILACPFEETEHKDLARSQRTAKKVLKELDRRFGPAELPDVSYATWEEEHPFSKIKEQRAQMRKMLEGMGIR